jgi:hypothetical protein
VPVGLLKNHIPGKTAIENKRVSVAIFAQMVLFQQPHCPYYPYRPPDRIQHLVVLFPEVPLCGM